jgi:hypothetical protein
MKYQNRTTDSGIEVRRNQKYDQKNLAKQQQSKSRFMSGKMFRSVYYSLKFCLAASPLKYTDVKGTNLHGQVSTCIKQKFQQDIRIRIAALDYAGKILISFVHCILGYTFSHWALLQISTCLVGGLDASCTIAPYDREARSTTVGPSGTPEILDISLIPQFCRISDDAVIVKIEYEGRSLHLCTIGQRKLGAE